MPYRVKDFSTGNYLTTSTAKSVDYKDPLYARVYPTIAGARSSARYQQNLHSHWFETEEFLLKRARVMPWGDSQAVTAAMLEIADVLDEWSKEGRYSD